MAITQTIIEALQRRQLRRRDQLPGPLGDFYRKGGNGQLHEIPVRTGDLVIDIGGYEGEWSAEIMTRYGCRIELFEAIPEYAEKCRARFRSNALVNVHSCAVGGQSRKASFSISSVSSSEFTSDVSDQIEIDVVDIADIVSGFGGTDIGCIKINIEGGEYELLERLIETKQMKRLRCLLIQFHRQPAGWADRLIHIERELEASHDLEWNYPLVWAKWVRRD